MQSLGPFALACLAMELTPGPNMAYLALLTLMDGRRAGFAATAGIALGLFIVGCVASLGVAAVVTSSPFLYQTLRWSGVAYLMWLAWQGLRDDRETSPAIAGTATSSGTYAVRGLTTNLLNPKAAIFYIAVLPTFVTQHGSVLLQSIALTAVHVLIATAVHSTIVLMAGVAHPLLKDSARSNALRVVMSVALALVAVWLAFATAR